ncbi:MAG TPA: amidase [Terriglobales bacterium]|nr:amidase [Terriglobales bacterium]
MTFKMNRRAFVASAAKVSGAAAVFPLLLAEVAEAKAEITKANIASAAALAGLEFDDQQQEMMLENLQNRLKAYEELHNLKLPNSVPPALDFNPVLPGMKFETARTPMVMSRPLQISAPRDIEDVAFWSVRDLGELIRRRKVSSLNLTEMYLERLKRYDPLLHFVITLTEDRATAQAKEADGDIARGKYRGPLHGIPWGAKDLLAVKGYPTTWGAGGFEKQSFEEDAEVVKRLDRAGAVLVAKTTLGALAMGDKWFGGMTRNPWKPDQGSSGSSAGSSSAVAAGCLGFAIGSETLGSISSPCTRCGATGLRPTFGRVPRTGAMALSWSMDKLGPIGRYVEDCAIVFSAIHGPDGKDRTVHDYAFNWNANVDIKKLRIGYLKEDFEYKADEKETAEQTERRLLLKKFDEAAVDVLRSKLKVDLIPLELPNMPWGAMRPILVAEAAAAFDELTRSGKDKLLTEQGKDDWPNTFRASRLIPAVEYINGNRARMIAMQKAAEMFSKADVVVAPTFSSQLLMTNLTGHPAVILPSGFRPSDGTPVSLTFLGDLFGEAKLLAVARAWEQATEFHKKHSTLEVGKKA